ncbi:hypothetical protein P3339_08335 [Microbulbifer sp. MLAF003]|uniref:hypothetical protein n=1 Tax=Microbulbifer sp. MLAF003 TaxID=3032582 RepID=UPI0024ACFE11|nr:hypothetical protein [Microbulbifer sp. MLAF003]WHI52756.1 hypothetical protein P3339_08335 [Microbulbifer sp. MLAF003]
MTKNLDDLHVNHAEEVRGTTTQPTMETLAKLSVATPKAGAIDTEDPPFSIGLVSLQSIGSTTTSKGTLNNW